MTAPKLYPKQRGRKGDKRPLFATLPDVAAKVETMSRMSKAERKKMFLAMSADEQDMVLQILQRRQAEEEAAEKRMPR
jgi:hypothetical protein